jgi:hypothetical protein
MVIGSDGLGTTRNSVPTGRASLAPELSRES